MIKRFPMLLLVLLLTMLFAASAWAQHEYVGVKSCKMCHKGEKKGMVYEIWEASKHAKATEAPATKGEEKNPTCLKCHSTGFGEGGYDPEAEDSLKFAGVQCEACHGPGKDYKKMSIMKDREAALANGLIIPTAETCVLCHNPSHHEDMEFDYETAWDQIKHELPKEEPEEEAMPEE